MERKWIEIAVISFGTGVLLRSFITLQESVLFFGLTVSASFALLSVFASAHVKQKLCLAAFVLAIALAGVARYELSEVRDATLGNFKDKFVSLEGVISEEPDVRDTLSFLTVSLDGVSQAGKVIPIKEKIRVAADRYPEFGYGDQLRITGKLVEPDNFLTESGIIFDYRSYLAKDGIYYEIFRPKIEVIKRREGNPVVTLLLDFKSAFLSATSRVIPEPENGLLAGIILGVKNGIPDELTDVFRRSGLVHIIVLSGYNLTIVAYAIMAFLRRLSLFLPRLFPKFVSPFAGVLGILAFTVMAGASATAVRAAIMALLAIFAGSLGRRYNITRALALAAFVMILQNPKVLAFDPSFELSFLATLGLIYLSPFLKRYFKWVPEKFGLREIVVATFATQVFVLPRLVGISGTISLVGVFANIIVLPFVPATMLAGALAGFGALLNSSIAAPFAFVAYFLLHGFIVISKFFASLPLAAIGVPQAPLGVFMLAYIPIIWFLVRRRIRV